MKDKSRSKAGHWLCCTSFFFSTLREFDPPHREYDPLWDNIIKPACLWWTSSWWFRLRTGKVRLSDGRSVWVKNVKSKYYHHRLMNIASVYIKFPFFFNFNSIINILGEFKELFTHTVDFIYTAWISKFDICPTNLLTSNTCMSLPAVVSFPRYGCIFHLKWGHFKVQLIFEGTKNLKHNHYLNS